MRWLLFLLALLGLLCRAEAHSVLVDSAPPDGARVAAAPAQVSLRFNETIAIIDVRLIDGAGAVVALPHAPVVRDTTIEVPLPDGLADGVYLVAYRITSADSHPVAGAIVFAVGATAGDFDAIRAQQPVSVERWRWPAVVLRLMLLVCTALVAGGILFALLAEPLEPASRRFLAAVAALGVVVALGNLVVRAALLMDAAPEALLSPATWSIMREASIGRAIMLTVAGFALAAWGLTRRRASGRAETWPALTGATAVIVSTVISGHAAARGAWPTMSAALIHAAVAFFWLGSFAPLLAVLRRDRVNASTTVRRFSNRAMIAVGVLIGAGIALAASFVDHPGALRDSDYGNLLVGKLVAVCALLALAARNRLWLVSGLDRDDARSIIRLARSIRAEIVLALPVLALAATLGMTPPPRAERAQPLIAADDPDHAHHADDMAAHPEGLVRSLVAEGLAARVELTPARAGRNRLELTLTGGDGQVLTPREVTIELANPALGIAGLRRRLDGAAPGRFALDGPEFAVAGVWRVRIDVLVTEFQMITLEGEITIH
jgi:copper transport protein